MPATRSNASAAARRVGVRDGSANVRPSRVVVGTDGSETAARAVEWAAELTERCGAELALVRVLPPPATDHESNPDPLVDASRRDIEALARSLAGERGSGHVVVGEDVAGAIVRAAADFEADTIVVGNVAMRGRKQFLLGNVPNRVSHQAGCTVVIVNTSDPEGDDVSPGDDHDSQVSRRELGARAAHIARVLAAHGLRSRRHGGQEREQARRFREALEELGPTFAKLGQVLSTRPDLVSPTVADELATLQDRCAPLSEAEVVSVMERELGVPWEDVFDSIDPQPLAAGTIAQVHRATLADGERAVVKVQRPTAEGEIERDLALLDVFAQRAGNRAVLRGVIDVPRVVEELSASLRRELDFECEAANAERLRLLLDRYPRLAVPRLYTELSTRRLLVMEEVQGVPLREAPPGEPRRQAARQLLESYYHQILVEGFFHADPHPGNLMWWQDRIYFLDLGMAGELDEEVRELLLLVLLAVAQDDASFLAELILMLAGSAAPADLDMESFRQDVGALLERQRHSSLQEVALGPMLKDMTQVALRHRVPLHPSLMLTGKALAQMQLAAAELDPEIDPFRVAADFILRTAISEVRTRISPPSLLYDARKLGLRAGRLVEAVERATGARPGAGIRVETVGVERVERAVSRAGSRVAAAMLISSAGLSSALVLGLRARRHQSRAFKSPRRFLQ